MAGTVHFVILAILMLFLCSCGKKKAGEPAGATAEHVEPQSDAGTGTAGAGAAKETAMAPGPTDASGTETGNPKRQRGRAVRPR